MWVSLQPASEFGTVVARQDSGATGGRPEVGAQSVTSPLSARGRGARWGAEHDGTRRRGHDRPKDPVALCLQRVR